MGRIGRDIRARVRMVVGLAGIIASGCSLVVSLDDHHAGPLEGDEGGIDGDVLADAPGEDHGSVGGDSGRDGSAGGDAQPPGCTGGVGFTSKLKIVESKGFNQFSARPKRGQLTGAYVSNDSASQSHIYNALRGTSGEAFGLTDQTKGGFQGAGGQRHAIVSLDDIKMFYVQYNNDSDQRIFEAVWSDAGGFQNNYTFSEINGTDPQANPQANTEVYTPDEGTTLYFASDRGSPGTFRIYWTVYSSTSNKYVNIAFVPGLDNPADEQRAPVVDVNQKRIFFARKDTGGLRIYHASRTGTSQPFANALPVCDINIDGKEQYPTWISADDTVLYYVQSNGSKFEIWQAQIGN